MVSGNKGNTKKALTLAAALFFIIALFLGRKFLVDKFAGFYNQRLGKTGDNIVNAPYMDGEVDNGAGNSIPEGFPGNFPIYPKTLIINSWSQKNNEKLGLSVIWETNDSVDKVVDFYNIKLHEIYLDVSLNDDPKSPVFSFKNEGLSGFMGITEGEGEKTIISVAIGID